MQREPLHMRDPLPEMLPRVIHMIHSLISYRLCSDVTSSEMPFQATVSRIALPPLTLPDFFHST